ncbi:MAG: hypothetical protein K5888_11670 [Lachnospiraceae bacterium]|nr:hypothetical protein [Lachnospiraceae bacterium]
MGIQFYNGLDSYLNLNTYGKNIPQVTPEEVRAADEAAKLNASGIRPEESKVEETAVRRPVKNAELEDISLTFNKEDTFDSIGSEASIKSLDMEEAISDMKKDDILSEYSYFVGSSKDLFSGDGIVIAK